MYDSFQFFQGQKWNTRIRWSHHWKILMACIYIYIYTLLKDNQEIYSFLCFKFYWFQKFTLKKDHIRFTLQSNCLSDIYFITMFALFNVFSNYFPAQELFQTKTRVFVLQFHQSGELHPQPLIHLVAVTEDNTSGAPLMLTASPIRWLLLCIRGCFRRRSLSRGLVIGLISGFGSLSISETTRIYLSPGLAVERENIFAQP